MAQKTVQPPPHGSTSPQRTARVVRGYPVVGILPMLLVNPLQALKRLSQKHAGEVVALRIGPAMVFFVTHPTHIEQVLSGNWRNFVKEGMLWKPLRRLIGNGMLTNNGEDWQRSRRLIQPLFTPKSLASLAEIMIGATRDATARLREASLAAKPLDMSAEMMKMTQGIAYRTLFSTGVDLRETETLANAILVALHAINYRIFLSFLPDWLPLPGDRAFHQAIRTVDEAISRLVSARRTSAEPRDDLLSLLLRTQDAGIGERVNDRQLRDELMTIFVAGTETTATATTWIWYLLSEHPEVERRLRAEVCAVLGARTPTGADLAKLPFTKMVVMETLRLYPPAWLFTRLAQEDDVIDGVFIPAGSTVLLSPYATQHAPAYWDHPEVFDPDRFSAERAVNQPRYAYFPFGGGPRQCIGMQFAIMEAQIVIAIMVQNFRLRRVPGPPIKPYSSSTLRPRGSLDMVLTPIKDMQQRS